MKIEEPEAMAEIHRIREKLYYITKGMTPQEEIEYFHNASQEILQKYDISLKQEDE